MGKTVGIDLGTTNSVVAVMEGGQPSVITNAEGSRTTPSVVFIGSDTDRKVGSLARRGQIMNSSKTISSVKRFMGHTYDEVKDELGNVAYNVTQKDSGVAIEIDGKHYVPEEISAMVLRKLKEDAEKYLGEPVTSAVITVPAYFNDAQRQATKNAGTIAGLEVLRIINEPTAAAVAYGLDKKNEETILVFDLGGGTFDVSVLEVGDGLVEVMATSGDSHLGGDDFDREIVDWLAEEFKADQGVDLKSDKQALQRLTEAAEKAKVELSTLTETNISLPFITADQNGPKHLEIKLSRSKFEELVDGLLTRIKKPVSQAIQDAKVNNSDIDEVVLVGGSSRIPVVQKLITDMIGKEPNQSVNPDEVVAIGAAVQAGVLAGEVKDVVLLDVTPLSLGIETKGGVFTKMIERNTTIPTKKSEIYSTAENNQDQVQVHILQGERPMARDNKSLGEFNLSGIPALMAGQAQIEVTFDIDANGILNVSAKEKTTGKEQQISIKASTNLGDDEIDRMVKEAESNAEADQQKKEEIDQRNAADSLALAAEKFAKDAPESMPVDKKDALNSKAAEIRTAIKDEKPIEEIKELQSDLENIMEDLQKWMQENPEAMKEAQEKAAAEAAGDDASASADNSESTVQAEFTEADSKDEEDKKD